MQNTTNTSSRESAQHPYQFYSASAIRIAKLCGCESQAKEYLSKNRTYDEITGFVAGMMAMHDSLQPCTFDQLIALPLESSKQAA